MRSQWIVKPKPLHRPNIKLLCFPYAGGGAPIYFPWKDKLHSGIELNIIQPPGRGTHFSEPPIGEMNVLVDKLIPQISDILSGEYMVFGHSVGSRFGFELVRQAINKGFPAPLHFFASGSSSPRKRCIEEKSSQLPDDKFINMLRKMNGTPPEVLENEELMQLFLPTLRADFRLAEEYFCDSNFIIPTDMTVLSGRDDVISQEQLDRWGDFALSSEVIMCDGGHFFVDTHSEQVINIVNEKISQTLSKVA